MKKVYLAGGCFWGLEDLFKEQEGITNTEVGYTGGENDNPDYHNHPGHAEALEVEYDPEKTSLKNILDFFFRVHNPTTLNQQGYDIGTQYRSEIFYTSEKQKKIAEDILKKNNIKFNGKIVTNISENKNYCKAEDYHQKYLER